MVKVSELSLVALGRFELMAIKEVAIWEAFWLSVVPRQAAPFERGILADAVRIRLVRTVLGKGQRAKSDIAFVEVLRRRGSRHSDVSFWI